MYRKSNHPGAIVNKKEQRVLLFFCTKVEVATHCNCLPTVYSLRMQDEKQNEAFSALDKHTSR